MNNSEARFVIVGASLAGLSAARTLRESGVTGSIVVIGDEPERPYDRPPLSKQVLTGAWDPDRADLGSDDADVTWALGSPACGLDLDPGIVSVSDGSTHPFDALVIATGSTPRALPGFDLPGVHTLRTRRDALALRAAISTPGAHVAIVGAGFIGAEIASACVDAGVPVTMLEADTVPLRRGLGPEVGAELGALYLSRGVDLILGATVDQLLGTEHVTGLTLTDGRVVEATVVIVGIGAVAETRWLDGSGLTLDNGVVCSATLEAAPGIVAAGDVARWPNARMGEDRRVEHWENAVSMGRHAALTLLGGTEAYESVPWVWSDQFGYKLQFVGSTQAYDEVVVESSLNEGGKLFARYRLGDRLVAACGIRRSKDVLGLRDQIGLPGSWAAAR